MSDTPYGALKLDSQLCFPLYATSRAVTRRYGRLLGELGLTYPQYLVCLVLWESEAPLSVHDIGTRLRLDSGTLTPLLKRLENAGLVERRRDREDERRVLISMTSPGMALREQAASVPAQLWEGMGLSEADAVVLHQKLMQVLTSLEGLDQD